MGVQAAIYDAAWLDDNVDGVVLAAVDWEPPETGDEDEDNETQCAPADGAAIVTERTHAQPLMLRQAKGGILAS